MRLDGIHHVTCISADAPSNVDFYVATMGLRLVKKTINFDVPDAYHLYFADEKGTPGSILTFFEYPDAAPGRAGDGTIHRILFRVAGDAALDFWEERLQGRGIEVDRSDAGVFFDDPEGLGLGIVSDRRAEARLVAEWPEVPEEHRLRGFEGVRAFAHDPTASEEILAKVLGFGVEAGSLYTIVGDGRDNTYAYDPSPRQEGVQGAGSVHHIAFACEPEHHLEWRRRLRDAGSDVTDVYDRKYFRSIYFREPSGVLFEIATKGPGFTVDEPRQTLGASLSLPDWEEHRRAELEQRLRPVVDPRSVH